MTQFNIEDWHWIVADDESRAWSSRVGAYVDTFPADAVTRVVSETELSDVLRPFGLKVPKPTADDVRAEAQRRIISLTGARDLSGCIVKQLNALMRVGEINDKQARGEALTAQEQIDAVHLRQMAEGVKAIRAASNELEDDPPADFKSDHRWP